MYGSYKSSVGEKLSLEVSPKKENIGVKSFMMFTPTSPNSSSKMVINSLAKLYIKVVETERYQWVNVFIQLDRVEEMVVLKVWLTPGRSTPPICFRVKIGDTKFVIPKNNEKMINDPQVTNLGESLIFRLINLEFMKEASKLFLNSGHPFEIDLNFVTICVLNNSFFSKWKFLLVRNGVTLSDNPEIMEGTIDFVVEEEEEDGKEENGDSNNLVVDEKTNLLPSKETEKKKIGNFWDKMCGPPADDDDELSEWKQKRYSNWSIDEVQEWMKHTYYTKRVNFHYILSDLFKKLEINGKVLDSISSKKELEDLKIQNFLLRERFYEELIYLRRTRKKGGSKTGGYFDDDRYLVLKKYIKKTSNQYSSDISDMKTKYRYTYDPKELVQKLGAILFNIPLFRNRKENPDYTVIPDIQKLIDDKSIEYFQFNIKVLAVVPSEEPKRWEKFGMKLIEKSFDTFFHLGLLIKNLQLDWFTNELIHVQSTKSQRPLLCVDVDCFCIEKREIFDWLALFAKEIITWNKFLHYVPFNISRKKNNVNCQEFVCRFISFLTKKTFKFPRQVKNFFDRIKKALIITKVEKEFEFNGDFAKRFKIKQDLVLGSHRLKFKKFNGEVVALGGGSPRKKSKKDDSSIVVFQNHTMLDLFYIHCLESSPNSWIDFYGHRELLKAYDRAYHIQAYYAQKKKKMDLFKNSSSDVKTGCPFNMDITKKDLERITKDEEIDEKKKEAEEVNIEKIVITDDDLIPKKDDGCSIL